MEHAERFRDLVVYQKARKVAQRFYELSKAFPKEERYALTSQIRRSVVSIPSNIAEGYGRRTTGEYIQALYVAYGSQCELETQVLLAGDLGDVERMLKGLIRSLEKKP